ncbi:hypothetical protein PQQ59_06115 [Paraburkholderia aspalathi]|uniref:hypothetical protein n=1 Tax=Paraburkholderia aspalathi TaxID=1324617 RepID=UPI0038BA1D35
MSMLLRTGLPATPVRMRCLPQEQAANAPRVPADVTPTLSFANCHYYKICCVCGEPLGQYKAFITGPLSAISRRCSEAPAHQDCAKFTAATQSRGAGLVMVWVTRTYEVSDGNSDVRVCIGDPEQVFWYLDGRCASRDEVRACFEAELPPLYTAAHVAGEEALLRLDMSVARTTRLFPRHAAAAQIG